MHHFVTEMCTAVHISVKKVYCGTQDYYIVEIVQQVY